MAPWGISWKPVVRAGETASARSVARPRPVPKPTSRDMASVSDPAHAPELNWPLRHPQFAELAKTLEVKPEPAPAARSVGRSAAEPVPGRTRRVAARITRFLTRGATGAETVTPQVTAPERAYLRSQLQGAAIDPAVAERYVRTVAFDHLGRVQHLPENLATEDLRTLRRSRVLSPTERNSTAPREGGPRTERDVMVHFMHRIDSIPGRRAQRVRAAAKDLWMGGNLRPDAVRAFLERIEARHGTVDPAIADIARDAVRAVDGTKSLTQYHDNLYGRRFDSAFVHELINDPPPEALASGVKQAAFLRTHLAKTLDALPADEQRLYLEKLAQDIGRDKRPWFGESWEIEAFLHAPTRGTLDFMLQPPTSGIDLVKMPYLAVKASLGLRAAGKSPEWMKRADEHYAAVVHPSRSTVPTGGYRTTDGFGLRLFTQPAYEKISGNKPAMSWADAKKPTLDHLPAFERKAMESGHPVINGASGSANILSFLNRAIQQADGTYSRSGSLMNTMMFLTYDGGHSLNEAYSVERALRAPATGYRDPVDDRAAMLRNVCLDYRELPALYRDPQSRARVENALDVALDGTIEYFRKHSFHANPPGATEPS